MRKRYPLFALALFMVLALVLSGCAPQEEPAEEPAAEEPAAEEPAAEEPAAEEEMTEEPAAEEEMTEEPAAEEPAAEEPAAEVYRAGMVTDAGGIDDKSFNATSWQGMVMAEEQLEGVETDYLESQQQTDYAPNISQFVDQGYDMIITVGFLLEEDTATFADQNPDISFAIVDSAYDPPKDNVLGLTFATDEAAFMAGYTAAAMTQTGVVGTFGGIKIPTVTIFMVGFESGVNYYNEQHGTDVTVLGWDTASDEGLFVGNFESTDDGRRAGEDLIAEGADIIMPVAGPVGLGTASAVQDNEGTMLIWVDTDGCVSIPEYCPVILTSVMKKMDEAVFEAVRRGADGEFEGGTYVGTLENDGVALAPLHEFEDAAPEGLSDELETIRQGIIAGEINTGWADYLASLGS